ncbi:MAG: M28 family metallopeptidase, partial [Planctomycetota bacterium]
PKIQAMVDQVNETNIQNVVQDLQDMGEREASSGGFVAETYLVDSFNAIGGLDVSTHHFSASYSDNVIAELPGTVDPSKIVVVGGHYDSTSWSGPSPGADDNASGTSGVREIARILSQHEFKYTLRFIAFGAEELGLVGSDAYCDLLVTQGANVIAMINLDMTAYRASGDARDVDFITNYSSSSLIDFCSDMYATYVPTLGVTQGSFSGGTSDHQSFTQHGYTACFPFEDVDNYSPYIHTSSDVIGTSANDFILAKMITQGALASLATLASPVDLEMQHTALTDTTDASGPYAVTATVSSLIGANVSQVTLHYDVGGGYVAKDMVYTGTGDEWISSIPGMTEAGYVKYYFEALDDLGNYERLPDGFMSDHYEFFVGYLNDVFADDFETNTGWTHGGTGQDDWQRDEPAGNGGYDPSYAASGAKVWGNDLGHGNYNGNYQPNVNNWLESPSIDCTGQTGIHLRYRRWLTVEEAIYDQAKILVNGNQVFKNANSGDHIDTAWELHDIDISAHADNNPDVRIKYTLTTDGGKELGGWTIDDLHVGTVSDGDPSTLSPSEVYVEISKGGFIDFALNGSAALGGRIYVLLVTSSGTSPGTPIGSVVLPLNWDVLTDICAANLNTPVFNNFLGILDGGGQAAATVYVPIITDPAAVGLQLDFAWLTLNSIDFASDPAGILLVP